MWPVSIWHISERAYCCSVAESVLSLCDPIACQAFLSSTVSWSLFGFMSVELEMPSSPFAFGLSQHLGLFQWVDSSHQVAKILELQHQSFQWIFRVDFLYDWLVWSPCSPIGYINNVVFFFSPKKLDHNPRQNKVILATSGPSLIDVLF